MDSKYSAVQNHPKLFCLSLSLQRLTG